MSGICTPFLPCVCQLSLYLFPTGPFSPPFFLAPVSLHSSFPVSEPAWGWQALVAKWIRHAWPGWQWLQLCAKGAVNGKGWEEVVRSPQTRQGKAVPLPTPLKSGLLVDGNRQGWYCWTEACLAFSLPRAPSQHPHPSSTTSPLGISCWGPGPSAGQPRSPTHSGLCPPGQCLSFAAQSLAPSRSQVQE